MINVTDNNKSNEASKNSNTRTNAGSAEDETVCDSPNPRRFTTSTNVTPSLLRSEYQPNGVDPGGRNPKSNSSSPVQSPSEANCSSSSSSSRAVAVAAPVRRSSTKKKVPPKNTKTSAKSAPWYTRNRSLMSTSIGPVTTAKYIRQRPKIITPSQDEVHFERCMIDLTQDSKLQQLLPGAKLSTIRKRHSLYFSYNPRGEKDIDCRYCPKCRCPKNYCCAIVFGDIVTRNVKWHINDLGLNHPDLNFRMVRILYNKYYSKMMNFKVLENGYKQETAYHTDAYYSIPGCMEALRDATAEKILAEAKATGNKRKGPSIV